MRGGLRCMRASSCISVRLDLSPRAPVNSIFSIHPASFASTRLGVCARRIQCENASEALAPRHARPQTMSQPALPPDIQQGAVQAVQAYIGKAFDAGQLPPFLSSSLRSGTLSLLQLIRVLGEYLTSEDERVRSQGVELLAHVVIDLDSEVHLWDKQTVKTLSNFFADKLEDGSNVAASIARSTNSADKVVPASAPSHRFKAVPEGSEMLAATLQALVKLIKMDGFGSEQCRGVARALIEHTVPRDHPQAMRFYIYSVVDALVAHHRNALKAMGKTFLKGYIQLAEGEKDPRNLMYLFAIDRVLMVEWELDEELAEVRMRGEDFD